MKKGKVGAKFDEKYTRENRIFPKGKTALIAVLLILQAVILIAVINFDPKPQDRIRQYDVSVEPLSDGSLDITYHFIWEALDSSEDLTWIDIGMANNHFSVYPDSVSDIIVDYGSDLFDGLSLLTLHLDRAYHGGEVLEFSFKVNQSNMLCMDDYGYFYEFVPGWFNETPVESYNFRWVDNRQITSISSSVKQDGYYTWNGSFEPGGYEVLSVRYGEKVFAGCKTVKYRAFDDHGAFNSLESDKSVIVGLGICGIILFAVIQVWLVDSVVSYNRGRDFLSGHGYYVHIYGRSNPHYIKARDTANASYTGGRVFGGRSGGGCACACACACAGGGRAGCSQKDTYDNSRKSEK